MANLDQPTIAERVRRLLASLPPGVTLLAAAKGRSADELRQAIEAGVGDIGHNYVQEAEAMRQALAPSCARWHLIGHLQHNKARRAAALFDCIQTVDSLRIAAALERHCAELAKSMPVLIEINSAREPNKTGVTPEEAEPLARQVAQLPHLCIEGLMTMGPPVGTLARVRLVPWPAAPWRRLAGEAEMLRPSFRLTRELFERLREARIPHVEMRRLSMGMSESYRVAIEEGANIIRIGTLIFGPRRS